MIGTREMILRKSLALFARSGYEAVSVRDIAGALGITQAALYKHYAGKRDIFDSIVDRMAANDREYSARFDVPGRKFSEDAQVYSATSPEAVARFSLDRFLHWTRDSFAADFRRMLTLEQYRSPEMSALYRQYLSDGVTDYLTDLFREMPGFSGKTDGRLPALKLYAPLYLLMNIYDTASDKDAVVALAREHIEDFFASGVKIEHD